MKRLAMLLALTVPLLLRASVDCMDTSYHLEVCCDTKELHEVECLCPCEKQYKLSPVRGECPKCGHYRIRDSREITIVKAAARAR